jgi:hypothetical protein
LLQGELAKKIEEEMRERNKSNKWLILGGYINGRKG